MRGKAAIREMDKQNAQEVLDLLQNSEILEQEAKEKRTKAMQLLKSVMEIPAQLQTISENNLRLRDK